ncbi:MAG: PAS domain S-box protein [Candidatus Xenobiia bacterium LiM19]
MISLEQALRNLIEHSSSIAWIKDCDGHFITANQSMEDMLGLSRNQISGHTVFDLFPTDIAEEQDRHDHQAIQTKSLMAFEEKMHVQGELRLFHSLRFPLIDENGLVYALGALSSSAIEDTRTGGAQSDSETRHTEINRLLTAVLDNTHIMAAFLDPCFNFVWVNRAYASSCRHEPSFFPGKNHFDLYPHQQNQAIFQQVADTGEPFFATAKPFEFPDQPERGVTWWDWSLIPIKDEPGVVTGLVFTLTEATERTRIEMALQCSEARFREMVELMPQTVFEINMEGRFLSINRSALDTWGYTAEEYAQGLTCFDIIAPEAHDCIRSNMEGRICGKSGGNAYTGMRKDGSRCQVTVYSNPVFLDGKPAGFRGIVIDDTERVETENRLRDEAAFRSVLADVRGVTGEKEEKTLYITFIDSLVLNYGFMMAWWGDYRDGAVYPVISAGHKDRSLDGLEQYISEHLMSDAQCAMSRAILDRRPFGYSDLEHVEGFSTWRDYALEMGYRSNLAVPFTVDGVIEGGIMVYAGRPDAFNSQRIGQISQLVSETGAAVSNSRRRREAENALRASEAEMRWLFRNMINAFVIFESVFDSEDHFVSYRFVYINDAYEQITGVKNDEVKGKTVHEVWPETEAEWIRRYGEVAVTGISQVFDLYHDPTRKFYHCSVYRPWDTRDRFCVIFENITEQKRAEEEREKLQTQLLQAQKMESIGRLAGGVAHDFNNMLMVILGHTDLAMKNINPSTPLYADLMMIEKAAVRSVDLTRQLLAFARRQPIVRKVLDMNDTIKKMLKMLRRLIREDVDLLWKPGLSLKPVLMDPSQIDQILANLIINARDAIVGVGTITIETENAVFDEERCSAFPDCSSGEYVMLAVSDNGSGMEKDVVEHLFEPFFTTKAMGRGTGLGLATVYGVVRQNDGFITVYSEPGLGTTFKLHFPRHKGDFPAEPAESQAEPEHGGKETVMIVDDEAAIIETVQMVLESLGYTVITAVTPAEALHLAEKHTGEIHLLITDVIMPGMTGPELSDQLRSLCPDLKALFISGYTSDVIAHLGVLEDGVHFIQKPFTRKGLAAKIHQVMGQKQPD